MTVRSDPGGDTQATQLAGTPSVIWAEPAQVPLARAVAARAGLRIAGLGGPSPGELTGAAEQLGAERIDDLRALIAGAGAGDSARIELAWILTPSGFGADQSEADAQAVLAARGRGVRIATLEPIPASALHLADGGWTRARHGVRPIDAIRFVPLARFGRAWREASEALGAFDRIRTLSVEAICHPSEGSLGARLFSAMELVHAIMGEPQLIEAAYAWPGHAASMHALPGETLRELDGDLSAMLRYADGRTVSVVCSNRGGAWSRRLGVLGSAGRLTITDDRIEWFGPEGEPIEATDLRDRAAGDAEAPEAGMIEPARMPAVRAIGEALSRAAGREAGGDPPTDHGAVLGMGQAALLSARTGQGESPGTIRRIAGGAA